MAISQAQRNTVLDELKRGLSLRQACKAADIPEPSSVLYLAENDPEYASHYAHARIIGWSVRADDLEDTAADMSIPADHKRIMVDTRKWMLSKMLPKLYGDRLNIEHSTSPTDALSTEELQAIIAAKTPPTA